MNTEMEVNGITKSKCSKQVLTRVEKISKSCIVYSTGLKQVLKSINKLLYTYMSIFPYKYSVKKYGVH